MEEDVDSLSPGRLFFCAEFRDFSLISTVPGQLAWQKRMIERLDVRFVSPWTVLGKATGHVERNSFRSVDFNAVPGNGMNSVLLSTDLRNGHLGSGNTQSFFLLHPPPPQAEVEEEEREWATSRYSTLIAFTSRTSRLGSVWISEKSRNFR